MKSESVDLVVFNAKIHGLDEKNQIHQAMAIRDGEIIEMGPDRQILNKYRFENSIDDEGKEIYPGFIDAHGHLFHMQNLNLVQMCWGVSLKKICLPVFINIRTKPNETLLLVWGGTNLCGGKQACQTILALMKSFPKHRYAFFVSMVILL